MSPKYDKYEPIAGGFRAPLAADLTFDSTGHFGPKAMSLDVNGRAVVGTAGQSGFVGVLIKNVAMTPNLGNIAGQVNAGAPIGGKAKDIVDIMTDGEIVGVAGLDAGTKYYAAANGDLSDVEADGPLVGWTVEATRLIVRCAV